MNRGIDAYLAELEARRFSHSRRHHSARTLERLLIYMREAHSITDWRVVNESQLRDFALYSARRHRSSRGKRISAATLRQWLSIIRSFFLWLNRTGRLLHNPAERLAFPQPEQSLPHVLNESEIAQLMRQSPARATVAGPSRPEHHGNPHPCRTPGPATGHPHCRRQSIGLPHGARL